MVKDYSKPSGWRYESYRHALAAKGISTNHKYYVRGKPFGKGNRPTGGVPGQYTDLPQPSPQAPLEKRIVSKAMYQNLQGENLKKAIELQNKIKSIEQARAGLNRDFSRSQSNDALYGKYGMKYPTVGDWADEIVRKTPVGDKREDVRKKLQEEGLLNSDEMFEVYRKGSGRERIEVDGIISQLDALESKSSLTPDESVQMSILQAQLASLGEMEEGKFTDDIKRYSELTGQKSQAEREFALVTGNKVGGSEALGSSMRMTGSETDKIRRANEAMTNRYTKVDPVTGKEVQVTEKYPDTPEERMKRIAVGDVVPAKTRTGELTVPSSDKRVKAVEAVAADQERRAAFMPSKEFVGLTREDERTKIPMPPGQIKGDLRGDFISVYKNPVKIARKKKSFDDTPKE